MGRNFVSVCHLHQVKRWYYRGEESYPMHDFYKKHDDCIRRNPTNVGTFDDQIQEELIPERYADDELPQRLSKTDSQDKRSQNATEEKS